MSPRTWLALLTIVLMCCDQGRSFEISTPRSLKLLISFKVVLSVVCRRIITGMRYTHSVTLFLIEMQLPCIRPVTKAIKVRLKHLYIRSQITKFSIDLCVIRIQLNIGRDTVSNIIYV